MLPTLVRRLLGGVLLIIALTFVTYAVANEIPQNKACIVISCNAQTTRAEMQQALHTAGFDRPVWNQYGDFLWTVVRHHSLGTSWTGQQLDSTIVSALPPTISLVAGGMLLTLLLALPLGAFAAVRARSVFDRGILTFSVAGLAVHPFVLAIGVQQFMAHVLGAPRGFYCPLTVHAVPKQILTPGEGVITHGGPVIHACGGPVDWMTHMAGPWIVFALFFVPIYVRMIRTRFREALAQRYVTTARAKGAGEPRVVGKHALPIASVPLLPMVATDAGTALTVAIYIETIFGLPGLGHLAVTALSGEFFLGVYDLPFIVAIVLAVGVFVVLLNAAADLASAWIDPRIRARATRGLLPVPRRAVAGTSAEPSG
ncbi:MAG: peptide/nickel transport system permease protein [Gaiellaceae bacterium]|nr:peptide/nickel transport system permease protein [Gaiellaceae bacterium]